MSIFGCEYSDYFFMFLFYNIFLFNLERWSDECGGKLTSSDLGTRAFVCVCVCTCLRW